MSRVRRNAEDWRRMVFRIDVKATVKVCCLLLADHMTTDRKVSRPRHLLASDLGVSERVVDRMISDAHAADLLRTITRGQKGRTAVYQGTFPDVQRERFVRAERAQNVRAESGFSANGSSAPIGKHDGSLTPCEPCGGRGCASCCGPAVPESGDGSKEAES